MKSWIWLWWIFEQRSNTIGIIQKKCKILIWWFTTHFCFLVQRNWCPKSITTITEFHKQNLYLVKPIYINLNFCLRKKKNIIIHNLNAMWISLNPTFALYFVLWRFISSYIKTYFPFNLNELPGIRCLRNIWSVPTVHSNTNCMIDNSLLKIQPTNSRNFRISINDRKQNCTYYEIRIVELVGDD